jgi:hypothetical protein
MSAEEAEIVKALIHRIEELDNPSDYGISRDDPAVEAARLLIDA